MIVYGKPERYMTEKATSIEQEIPYYQFGRLCLDKDTEKFAIPCDMETVFDVNINVVKRCCDVESANTSVLVQSCEPVLVDEAIKDGYVHDYTKGDPFYVGEVVQYNDVCYVVLEKHDADTVETGLANKWITPLRNNRVITIEKGQGAVAFTYTIYGRKDN